MDNKFSVFVYGEEIEGYAFLTVHGRGDEVVAIYNSTRKELRWRHKASLIGL